MTQADGTRPAPAQTMAIPAKDHPAVPLPKTGVLLLNLGTPDATDYWSMRRYLDEFLSDRRVIEWPAWIWQPILKGIVLTTRPKKSGHAYDQIWDRDTNESPLRRITREQTEGVKRRLAHMDAGDVVVDFAMRYGNPSVASVLEKMQAQGCVRVLMLALYPQYSATTTATAYDQSFRALMAMRWQPAVRTVGPYHDDAAYIDALARSVDDAIAPLDTKPEVLLTSYHGLPQSYFQKGDPYHCHCHKTTRLLRERLGWEKDRVRVTFQSRFGPEEWLQPYTDQTVEALAKDGVKHIAMMTPGFSADCVETLEEINIGVRETFLEAGGETFTYIPCLNADTGGLDVIEAVLRRELSGWVDLPHRTDLAAAAE